MSRPIGLPKTGGRVKGTPNKSTEIIEAACCRNNYSPIDELIEVAQAAKQSGDLNLRYKCASELMGYLYPKRKAIDIQEPIEEQPQQKLVIEFIESDGNGRQMSRSLTDNATP